MRGGPALAPESEDGRSRGEEARSVARGSGAISQSEQGTEMAEGGRGWGKRLYNNLKALLRMYGIKNPLSVLMYV